MPILLYAVGAVVLALGAAMIGYGIPNNEFGIGNTLIVAGTTAFVGGLIIIALGIAVAQLQRLAEALATRAPIRSSRPFDTFDPAAAAAAAGRPQTAIGRVPFPPKTKPENRVPESKIEAEPRTETAASFQALAPFPDLPSDHAPPVLANPDETPVTAAAEAFLSPLHPAVPPPFSRKNEPEDLDRRAELDRPHDDADQDHDAPTPAAPRAPNTFFDTMWPAEPKSEEPMPSEPKQAEPKPAEPKTSEFRWASIRRSQPGVSEPRVEVRPPLATDTHEPVPEPPAEASAELEDEEAPRSVAILKSGVVDGMGYTLYVDGSIEAELPQGTLRFASINELRSHLEKTS